MSNKQNDTAAIRSALSDLCNSALKVIVLRGHDAEDLRSLGFYIDKANLALAKPPRNCDVGKPKDWSARFTRFCIGGGMNCEDCKLEPSEIGCIYKWLDVPYEESEGEVDGSK